MMQVSFEVSSFFVLVMGVLLETRIRPGARRAGTKTS
jgi:hypothetical protein